MKFIAIIPARYASTRFPGKPLALLHNKPIIQWVYERVKQVFSEVIVATDDHRILEAVNKFDGKAILTSIDHKSGTDRCYEAYIKSQSDADIIVNIQGDEPFITVSQLESLKKCFDNNNVEIATLVKPFNNSDNWEKIANPNSPKVVVSTTDFALYFSRSVIPFIRGRETKDWHKNHLFYKHIGVYAFKNSTLKQLVNLPPSLLEQAESLEQLRWLENGFSIKVGKTDIETIGIDTPEDLQEAEKFLQSFS